MSSTSFPVGVASVLIPTVGASALPSFDTLTFSASGTGYVNIENNSSRQLLDTSATYQVILTPFGVDISNGGYTVGRGTLSSGNLTLTANQGIKVSATAANLALLGGSVGQLFCISVWLKTGAGDFKLVDHAYVDPSYDFVHVIGTKPRANAITKTAAQLQSTTSDNDLGSRDPYGCVFSSVPTTTGGVQINRTGEQVSFSPDTAANFNVKTTRTASISFRVLAADVRDIVLANAGLYTRITHGGTDYEEAQMSEYSVAVSVPGSRPLKLVMPPDNLGFQTIRMYLGCVLQNQEDNTESYTKDQQIETAYSYNAVPNDTLTNNMNTELHWKIRA